MIIAAFVDETTPPVSRYDAVGICPEEVLWNVTTDGSTVEAFMVSENVSTSWAESILSEKLLKLGAVVSGVNALL